MSPELDEKLCKKYPKIFKARNKGNGTPTRYWGFQIGDGWFNLINLLCDNIQHRIDWNKSQRVNSYLYNRKLRAAIRGNSDALKLQCINVISYDGDYIKQLIDEKQFREIPAKIKQVSAIQVKEKLGGLRFYYTGGDSTIFGMVQMTESIANITCEDCGNLGQLGGDGWMRVKCDIHRK